MIRADDLLDRRLGLQGRRGRRRRPIVRVRNGCCLRVGAPRCRRRRDAVVHRAPLRPRRAVAHARRSGARSRVGAAAGRGRPARGAAGRVRRPRGEDGGAHRCRVHPARGRLSGRGVQRPGGHAAPGEVWPAMAEAFTATPGTLASVCSRRSTGRGGRWRFSGTTGGGPGRRHHRAGRLTVRARLRPPGGRPPRAARRAPAPPPDGRRIPAPQPDRGGRRSRGGGCRWRPPRRSAEHEVRTAEMFAYAETATSTG